jgi:outer membrane protein OmpA-like peptidoglycan-associated protein
MNEKGGHRSLGRRAALAAVATFAALAASPAAQADQGFALPRFEPSFGGDKLFGVQSPYTAGEHAFMATVLLDYAHEPLVVRDASGKNLGAVVSDQTLLHLHASYALLRAVTFDVDLPFGFQHGEKPTAGGVAFGDPTSGAVGDLRLGVRATLYGDVDDPFQLGFGAMLWVPTGSRAAYLSDGTVRSVPMVIAGGATKLLVWSANIGPDLRPHVVYSTIDPGPAIRWGLGVGFLPGDGTFQVGPEASGAIGLDPVQKSTTDVEVLAGARARFAKSFVAGVALGAGVTSSVGTPDFRTVLSIAYAPPVSNRIDTTDRDHDGIRDAEDACPDEPGPATSDPKTNGCPPPVADRDGDGIPDAEDACPDVPGVRDPVRAINGCPPDRDNDGIPDAEDACPDQIGPKSADPKKNGCPLPADRDGDGIPDAEDACPDVPGVRDADPKKNGCPGDRDKDGIPDDKDACPDEKGPADPDPKKNGCPREVRVAEGQIVLLQQVEFDLNKATIRPASNGLLDALVQVVREHPEIVKIEVQGHTDNKGVAEDNLKLSQQRAEAVVAALVKRGVEAGRLAPVGYGATRPIMSNLTTVGRQKNRRVELHILEKRAKTP